MGLLKVETVNIIIYLFVGICAAFACIAVYYSFQKKQSEKLIFKSVASVSFVLVGVFSMLHTIFSTWQVLIIAGLVFGLMGDIFLAVTVSDSKDKMIFDLFGVAAFVVGHICYILAFSVIAPRFNLWLIFLIVAFPAAIVLMQALKVFKMNLRDNIIALGYSSLLGVMLAFAVNVTVCRGSSLCYVFLAVGAALFAASDVVRCLSMHSVRLKDNKYLSFSLLAYYAGQLLIALALGI
jgi:uncharacterized membrane protein YhhN